jgi:hypothetical protein
MENYGKMMMNVTQPDLIHFHAGPALPCRLQGKSSSAALSPHLSSWGSSGASPPHGPENWNSATAYGKLFSRARRGKQLLFNNISCILPLSAY